jgi:alpha-2-macroglobulin
MEKNIRTVQLSVKTNDLLQVVGGSSKTIDVKEIGEQLAEFDINVLKKTGVATVEVFAVSGIEKTSYKIELDVRNPNPRITDIYAGVIDGGQEWEVIFVPPGLAQSNKAVLELSAMPPLNLEKRLKYLIAYPYGCVEQTTSSVFPQLFLSGLVNLSEIQKADIDRNVKAGIDRLNKYQRSSGGFSYWPGTGDADHWSTSYVGHFLIEAEKKGFSVSEQAKKAWKKFQKQRANDWNDDGSYSQSIQAYRLFTLALAGEPEMGAMNRLKEKAQLSTSAKWFLAAAYCHAGKNKIAEKIIENADMRINPYIDMYYTYGSDTRDEAIILHTLALLGKKSEAYNLLKELSEKVASDRWMSTQSTAFALVSISDFAQKSSEKKEIKAGWSLNNGKQELVASKLPVYQSVVPVLFEQEGKVIVKNNSSNVIFARLIVDGIPAVGVSSDAESDLKMDIKYLSLDGNVINPSTIQQGTDFIAEVKVFHPGYRDSYHQLALNQVFPSGWEIINSRMVETGDRVQASIPSYQDFRDDRVYTFFNLYKYNTNVYRIMLTASYVGKFYMPATTVEAMYDNTIYARKQGEWVEVVKPK